jgi:hypothetical protein
MMNQLPSFRIEYRGFRTAGCRKDGSWFIMTRIVASWAEAVDACRPEATIFDPTILHHIVGVYSHCHSELVPHWY